MKLNQAGTAAATGRYPQPQSFIENFELGEHHAMRIRAAEERCQLLIEEAACSNFRGHIFVLMVFVMNML
jgi:hypothetical protein